MADDIQLIPITDDALAETPLAPFGRDSVYRLIRQGKLRAVRIGRRRFLTRELIAESLDALAHPERSGEAA